MQTKCRYVSRNAADPTHPLRPGPPHFCKLSDQHRATCSKRNRLSRWVALPAQGLLSFFKPVPGRFRTPQNLSRCIFVRCSARLHCPAAVSSICAFHCAVSASLPVKSLSIFFLSRPSRRSPGSSSVAALLELPKPFCKLLKRWAIYYHAHCYIRPLWTCLARKCHFVNMHASITSWTWICCQPLSNHLLCHERSRFALAPKARVGVACLGCGGEWLPCAVRSKRFSAFGLSTSGEEKIILLINHSCTPTRLSSMLRLIACKKCPRCKFQLSRQALTYLWCYEKVCIVSSFCVFWKLLNSFTE